MDPFIDKAGYPGVDAHRNKSGLLVECKEMKTTNNVTYDVTMCRKIRQTSKFCSCRALASEFHQSLFISSGGIECHQNVWLDTKRKQQDVLQDRIAGIQDRSLHLH